MVLVIGTAAMAMQTLHYSTRQQAATKTINSRETLCTATTPQYCGRIVIRKIAVPQTEQDFTFTHNVPGVVSPVMLDDDGMLGNPLNTTTTLTTPYNGTFSLSETLDPNYQTTIACTDPSGGTTSSGSSVSINILNGETVQCVFTNTRVIGQVPTGTGPTTNPTDPGTPGTVLTSTSPDKVKACQSNTWTQRADLPGIRAQSAGFSVGSKGYIGTGFVSSQLTESFFQYDPVTNTWTQKANFGGGIRHSAVGFSIGSKGYLGLGKNGYATVQDMWEYDPATNVWTQKADFPPGGPRTGATGFSIGTKGYVGLGRNAYSATQDMWEYDPATNVWTIKGFFGGGPRIDPVSFSIGSKAYVGTGLDGATFKDDFWEYDPTQGSLGTWTQKADFAGGNRAEAAGFSIGTKGYVGIGRVAYDTSVSVNDFWEYDPATNTWTQKANFGGTARSAAVGFSIGLRGYIGTGIPTGVVTADGGMYRDFWEYCP